MIQREISLCNRIKALSDKYILVGKIIKPLRHLLLYISQLN